MLFEKRQQLEREYHDWIRSCRIGDNFLNAIAFLESRGMLPVFEDFVSHANPWQTGDSFCRVGSTITTVTNLASDFSVAMTAPNPNAETINLTPEQAAAFQECEEPILVGKPK